MKTKKRKALGKAISLVNPGKCSLSITLYLFIHFGFIFFTGLDQESLSPKKMGKSRVIAAIQLLAVCIINPL